jgi:hypothetical protein
MLERANRASFGRPDVRTGPARLCDTSAMAGVIELVGAPGAGKSTLAGALVGSSSSGRSLVAADALNRLPRLPQFARFVRRRRVVTHGVLDALLTRQLLPSERRAALRDRAEAWRPLLEFLADRTIGADEPRVGHVAALLRRLEAPVWLLHTLELHALAPIAPPDALVVVEEGLLQRTAMVCGPTPTDEVLDAYLSRLPPIDLAVHLRATPATLVDRVERRREAGRVNTRHDGLSRAELERSVQADLTLLARVIERHRALGGAVLELDSGDAAADELVRLVIERLP